MGREYSSKQKHDQGATRGRKSQLVNGPCKSWKVEGTGQILHGEPAVAARDCGVYGTQRMHASTRRINTANKARVGDGTARARDRKKQSCMPLAIVNGISGALRITVALCACLYYVCNYSVHFIDFQRTDSPSLAHLKISQTRRWPGGALGGRETRLEELKNGSPPLKCIRLHKLDITGAGHKTGRMGPSRSLRWQQPSIPRLGLTLLALGFEGTLCQSTPTIRKTGRSDSGRVLII